MKYSKEIKEWTEEYDLVVCGAGMAGFSAALSAAEEGLKVLLVENNACVGGVATSGLVNHILGGRTYVAGKLVSSIGGIYARLEDRLLKENGATDVASVNFDCPPQGWFMGLAAGLVIDGEKTKLVLEDMLIKSGVKILYNTRVVDVVKESGRIKGIVIHNKNGFGFVKGKYFADTTGDADVCALAECPFDLGDENSGVAPASLELHVDNVDTEKLTEYMKRTNDRRFRALIAPLKAEGIWDFPYEIFISVKLPEEGVYMINTNRMVGVDALDAESITKGVIEARKETYRLFGIMRQYFPGFENARIRNVAPTLGIRESRRIEGEYVLTVNDLLRETDFEDTIAYSVYGWDLPDPKKPSHQPDKERHKGLFTPIPYRALVPKGVDNLIVAGRCISVERPVLGPVRVMAPCIAMGEAAGYATKLALVSSSAYRDVDASQLRDKIAQKGGIVEVGKYR